MIEKVKSILIGVKGSLVEKKLFASLGLGLVLVALSLGVILLGQTQLFRPQASEDKARLFFGVRNLGSKAIGEEFPLGLVLDAGDFNITGVDITLQFPASLEAGEFEAEEGNFTTILIPSERKNSANNFSSPKTVRFTAVNAGTNTKSGIINLGSVSFTGVTAGRGTIRIQKAQVVASGDQNKEKAIPLDTQAQTNVAITAAAQVSPTVSPVEEALIGDVDNNGCLDGEDGKIIVRLIFGGGFQEKADINNDGKISYEDYAAWLTLYFTRGAKKC